MSALTPTAGAVQAPAASPRGGTAGWTFALVSAGGVVMTLDVTVVNVALSAIARDLEAGLHQVQWTVSAYSLAFGALLLTAGALSDRLGRRAVFVTGISLFTLASALCGLAPDARTLIAARVAQGLGGAMVFAPSLALLAAVYEGERRRRAIATYAVIASAAGALGPVVGGLLVETLGWRWIFLVNLPIGVGIILGALMRMPALTPVDSSRRVDPLGALLAIGVLLSLHSLLMVGPEAGWLSSRVLVLACSGAVLLVALAVSQRRPDSMLDLELLRIPAFSGAAVLGFLARMSSLGVLVFTTLWLQSTGEASALRVGLRLLPLTGSLLAVGLFTARLQARFSGAAVVSGGFALQGLGLLCLAGAGAGGGEAVTFTGLVLLGAGGAILFPPLMGVAVSVVPPHRTGMASGLTNACYPLGTATGVALFGAVFSARLGSRLDATALSGEAARHVRSALETGQLELIEPALRPLVLPAFADAYQAVCVAAAGVCLLGAVLALRVLSVPTRQATGPAALTRHAS
ncbi:MFS transporter [Archangium gephyra]|uniref:MFS transporter n=1 Tax=Archangium gephyra TaxID=48 RepID=UPI003B76410E